MLSIPPALQAQFEECLRNKAIPKKTHGSYKKWLRYYPDFCNKYDLLDAQRESLPPFLLKVVFQQVHGAVAEGGDAEAWR